MSDGRSDAYGISKQIDIEIHGEKKNNAYEIAQKLFGEPKRGDKYDSGKPRTDLVPSYSLLRVAEVFGFGSTKYAPHNWRFGIKHMKLIGGVLRHIYDYLDGVNTDKESGLHPLAHAAAGILMLIDLIKTHPELDDRYKADKNAS